MKKHNLALVLLMAVVMLFTGCAKEEEVNPFLGKWTGTLDMTQQVVEAMVAEDADLEKYVKFENLTFTFVFEFAEDEMKMKIEEASKQQFNSNMETGVANMVDAMVADVASENGITIEEVYAGMGVTRDEYVQYTIENMDLDVWVNEMSEALELSGSYEYDEENIVILYEDNTYEEVKYVLGIEDLTITFTNGTDTITIPCTKAQ